MSLSLPIGCEHEGCDAPAATVFKWSFTFALYCHAHAAEAEATKRAHNQAAFVRAMRGRA